MNTLIKRAYFNDHKAVKTMETVQKERFQLTSNDLQDKQKQRYDILLGKIHSLHLLYFFIYSLLTYTFS